MQKYLQITFAIPEKDAGKMRKLIGEANAGRIDHYAYGSFSIKGIGRGKALQGADPTVGEIGELEANPEEKIETFCKEEDLEKIITVIKNNHPYEKPIIIVSPVTIY